MFQIQRKPEGGIAWCVNVCSYESAWGGAKYFPLAWQAKDYVRALLCQVETIKRLGSTDVTMNLISALMLKDKKHRAHPS